MRRRKIGSHVHKTLHAPLDEAWGHHRNTRHAPCTTTVKTMAVVFTCKRQEMRSSTSGTTKTMGRTRPAVTGKDGQKELSAVSATCMRSPPDLVGISAPYILEDTTSNSAPPFQNKRGWPEGVTDHLSTVCMRSIPGMVGNQHRPCL